MSHHIWRHLETPFIEIERIILLFKNGKKLPLLLALHCLVKRTLFTYKNFFEVADAEIGTALCPQLEQTKQIFKAKYL